MQNIKEHISKSKEIHRCKNCKSLFMSSYFGQTLCTKCDKIYNDIL